MADRTPSPIRSMFDRISARYDLLNHLLSLGADLLWRRRAAALQPAPRIVLDVCTGTGDLALEFARRRDIQVTGTDFSTPMLRLARRKAERGDRRNVFFLAADTLHLPFRNGTFDVSSSAFGVRNLRDPLRGIAEMARVVRPGGLVLILEFTLPPHPLWRAAYRLYFDKILPRLGRLLSPREDGAYRYLPDSVARWPTPREFQTILERAGLREVSFELLLGGVAALHRGVRPR